jgi:hypothetical protein
MAGRMDYLGARCKKVRMKLIWGVLGAALVLSVVSLLMTVNAVARTPNQPLHDINIELLADEVTPFQPVDLIISGCADQKVTVFVYAIWVSPTNLSHLGPANGTETDVGCNSSTVGLTVPNLPPGHWRLALLVLASYDGRVQVVQVESNRVTVGP